MEFPVTLIGWLGFAVIIAIGTITALGTRGAMNYAKANIKNQMFDTLRKWAGTYVGALAQDPYLKGLASEEKKEKAMLWIVNKSNELGFPITTHEAGLLIENAVWFLKNTTLPSFEDDLSDTPKIEVMPAG